MSREYGAVGDPPSLKPFKRLLDGESNRPSSENRTEPTAKALSSAHRLWQNAPVVPVVGQRQRGTWGEGCDHGAASHPAQQLSDDLSGTFGVLPLGSTNNDLKVAGSQHPLAGARQGKGKKTKSINNGCENLIFIICSLYTKHHSA